MAFFVYNLVMKIVLASASPRRKEILSNAGYIFDVVPSFYVENISNLEYSKELVENCALQKALDVKNRVDSDSSIVSADTVVVLNNKILGKPDGYDDAFQMLKMLSNRTHFVATSICLIKGDDVVVETETTNVTFRKLSSVDIKKYIENCKPFDKAGSYGIQDNNFDFVVKIEGNIDNVVGFSLSLFEKIMNQKSF